MNEWYPLVDKYKKEHNLTWPQFASELGVSERDLRRRDNPPSKNVITQLRKIFPNETLPEGLRVQQTTFINENTEKTTKQTLNPKKSDLKEIKIETNKQKEQKMDNKEKDKDQPTISEEEADRLLILHEYVRDPILQDIWITALERELIDTPAFQRLRNLKQLGPTHLVYPGATHSRFIHSIGTLYWAQQLIDVVNRNYDLHDDKTYLIKIENYQKLVIRTCALLHDLAHMPFGHTLENEGNLRQGEWKDSKRVELWLGESDKSIAKTIKNFLIKSGISVIKSDQFIQDIKNYIIPVDKKEHPEYPMNLEYPFIADIVGNTLCADLLDYLDRDMYYCGLRERSGDRVVKYLAVLKISQIQPKIYDRFKESNDNSTGKGRVVLLAYRIERQHSPEGGSKVVQKLEIKSEAIDLIRRRYTLAEKVYFHRTKIAASAMLISATASGLKNWEEIFDISDDDFLIKLRATNPRAKHIIDKYNSRQLYKPLYEIKYRPRSDEDIESIDLYDKFYPNYRKPSWRTEKEKEIEEIADLEEGTIVIYCPELGMNLKQCEMLVQNHPGDEIKPLKDIVDLTRQKEMEAINERFEQMWKLQIFVDPNEIDPTTPSERLFDLNRLCQEAMGFPNERTDLDLKGKGRSSIDQIAGRVIREYQEKHLGQIVPHNMFDELVRVSSRVEGASRIEQYRKNLEALIKSSR